MDPDKEDLWNKPSTSKSGVKHQFSNGNVGHSSTDDTKNENQQTKDHKPHVTSESTDGNNQLPGNVREQDDSSTPETAQEAEFAGENHPLASEKTREEGDSTGNTRNNELIHEAEEKTESTPGKNEEPQSEFKPEWQDPSARDGRKPGSKGGGGKDSGHNRQELTQPTSKTGQEQHFEELEYHDVPSKGEQENPIVQTRKHDVHDGDPTKDVSAKIVPSDSSEKKAEPENDYDEDDSSVLSFDFSQAYTPYNLRDSEQELYDNINKLYNPSPYIKKAKLHLERQKAQGFNDRVALKMLEKMVASTQENIAMMSTSRAPGVPLDKDKVEFLKKQIDTFEKRLKELDRRKRESAREKQVLLEQVNSLEMRALKMQEMEVMKRILRAEDPSEEDVAALEQLEEVLHHRDNCSRELRLLERKNRVMERVINNSGSFLPPIPWQRELTQNSSMQLIIPKLPEQVENKKKRIQFNSVGLMFTYDGREAPIKVPHFTSERVQKIDIKMDPEVPVEEIDDEILLEEKIEELRRKKQEEKYVKVTVPLDEDEDEEEGTSNGNQEASTSSFDSSISSIDSNWSTSKKKGNTH